MKSANYAIVAPSGITIFQIGYDVDMIFEMSLNIIFFNKISMLRFRVKVSGTKKTHKHIYPPNHLRLLLIIHNNLTRASYKTFFFHTHITNIHYLITVRSGYREHHFPRERERDREETNEQIVPYSRVGPCMYK